MFKILSGGEKDTYIRILGVLILVLAVIMTIANPGLFMDGDNFASMSVQLSELGMFSVAMTLAILIGGIDLSIVAVANLSAILAALVMKKLLNADGFSLDISNIFIIGLSVALMTGFTIGWINGLLIAKVGVPSILATLGTMTVVTGLALGITNGSSISDVSSVLAQAGNSRILGVPIPFIVFILVWFVADVVVRKTAFGTSILMVGTSLKVARFSGLPTDQVIIKTHIASALIAALVGFVTLMRTNSAHADYGQSYVLLSILVVVLGGVSVVGGAGKLLGVLWALVILQFLSTGLNMMLLTVSDGNFFRDFIWGFLLLLVMSMAVLAKKFKWVKHSKRAI